MPRVCFYPLYQRPLAVRLKGFPNYCVCDSVFQTDLHGE